MKLADRIAITASVLDRTHPSWYKKIDVKGLNMCDGNTCVAGQLAAAYGVEPPTAWGSRYIAFARKLIGKTRKSERATLGFEGKKGEIDVADFAFTVGFGTSGKTAWKNEIRARLALEAAKAAS